MTQEFLNACRKNNVRKIEELIAQGFKDFTYEDNKALSLAIQYKCLDVFKLLTEQESVLKFEAEHGFPILRAATKKQPELARKLAFAIIEKKIKMPEELQPALTVMNSSFVPLQRDALSNSIAVRDQYRSSFASAGEEERAEKYKWRRKYGCGLFG